MIITEINWDQLVKQVSSQEGELRTFGVDFFQNLNQEFDPGMKLLLDAGYTSSTAEWINFYPSRHFDELFVEQFSKIVGATVIRAWVSKVNPGKCAPWHQDIDDHESSYSKYRNLYRANCFISKPQTGHVFLVENNSFYLAPQGLVYEWPNRLSWHSGINCGIAPKYLFNFLGYR
jgi:hypothetical protein